VISCVVFEAQGYNSYGLPRANFKLEKPSSHDRSHSNQYDLRKCMILKYTGYKG